MQDIVLNINYLQEEKPNLWVLYNTRLTLLFQLLVTQLSET